MLLWSWIGSDLDIELIWVCIPIIFLSWNNCLTKHALKTDPLAVKELNFLPLKGCWQLKFVNEQQIFVNLCSDSVLIFGISLLKFKHEGYFLRSSVLITRSTVGKENFRQLRKWWRQHGKISESI